MRVVCFVMSAVLLTLLTNTASEAHPADEVLIQALDFTGGGSAWTVLDDDTGLPLVFEKDADPTKVGFDHPNTTDTAGYNLYQQISAPAGFSMSDIRLEANVSGFSSHVMLGRIGLGFTPKPAGTLYDYWTGNGVAYNGQVVIDQPLDLDATGDESLSGQTSVYVGVEVAKGLAAVSQEVDISELKVYAHLTPLSATLPGARDPLTFKSSGLYGGWNGYFTNATTPFDHFIVQAVATEGVASANTTWNTNLQQARSSGKRIIADLIPQASDGMGGFFGISELTSSSPDSDLDKLASVVSEFLAEVDENDLYAVTLGEEQIFSDGRAEQLNKLYDKIKVNHPNLPVYQWYTPSSIGTAPGISGFPNLNSDGWVSDEYHLDQPAMEENMRAYVIQQKSNANIIWAGGDAFSVPYIQQRFDDQVAVHKKYDIPASYFTLSGVGGLAGFDAGVEPVTAARFEVVKNAATAAALDPGPDLASWDNVPWTIPTIELAFLSQSDVTPFYSEDYVSDQVIRFVNDTDITGFANLRWDSSAVELRPRSTGAATSSVAYSFVSAFPLTELRVDAPGFLTGGTDGAVTMSVLDENGNVIQTTNMTAGGAMSMIVPGASFPGREFQVVYTMTGTSASIGDVLAGVNSIDVDADVMIPVQQAIDLVSNPGGGVSFAEDLSGMSIFHTASFNNIAKVAYSAEGLFANTTPGTLEVIQEFNSPADFTLTSLIAEGAADENNPAFLATLGIGYSLDGVNILGQITSSGSFSGELELDLSGLALQPTSFFVHLLLDGNFGLMTSFSVEGFVPADPGDFDTDGDVDGKDFLSWQRGASPNPLSASDLAVWEANFGTSPGPLAGASAAVPEPGSAALLGIALGALALVRLRGKKAR